jgi:hypothetical protein
VCGVGGLPPRDFPVLFFYMVRLVRQHITYVCAVWRCGCGLLTVVTSSELQLGCWCLVHPVPSPVRHTTESVCRSCIPLFPAGRGCRAAVGVAGTLPNVGLLCLLPPSSLALLPTFVFARAIRPPILVDGGTATATATTAESLRLPVWFGLCAGVSITLNDPLRADRAANGDTLPPATLVPGSRPLFAGGWVPLG